MWLSKDTRMLFSGLPSFDADTKVFAHRKFALPISEVMKMERATAFGFLWGVKFVDYSGKERICLVAATGRKRAAMEGVLDAELYDAARHASDYWHRKFTDDLSMAGAFTHAGVTVKANGDILSAGISVNLANNRLSHEIDNDTVTLKFRSTANNIDLQWKPGIAMDAGLAAIYSIRENLSRFQSRKVSTTTAILREKARGRIHAVIRDLATVVARTDLLAGRAKLLSFLRDRDLGLPLDSVIAAANKLIIKKAFIQKSFEDIIRYYTRTSQFQKPAELFEELILLAVHDGRFNAKQLFSLYEVGLHLMYSLPRITAMIVAVQTGQDPRAAADEADRREIEERDRRQEAERLRRERCDTAAEDEIHDDFEDFEQSVPLPATLVPMMVMLGLHVIADRETLRAAWMAKLKSCHPDTLPPGASREEIEEANRATSEYNSAYELLLKHLQQAG